MKLFVYLFLLLAAISSRAQKITTVAGNGTYGNSGNGGPATKAQLAWPVDIITDTTGNMYIADQDNNVIRKVDPTGVISIFAGTASPGYSGDGGPATAAQLHHPGKMCFDGGGNLYFTDQNGDVIRKIGINGIITSITTYNPVAGYSGDNGPLIAARFSSISGITFDQSGNMFIADYGNHVIRKVNPAGIVSTYVGDGTSGSGGDGGNAGSAQLNAPYAVVFDKAGNMYIPDNENHHIRKVNPSGIISTFCGTGAPGYSGDGASAIMAKLRYPWTIAVDREDNLYIGDAGNRVIRKVDENGIISTYAGNGTYGNTGDGGLPASAALGIVSAIRVDQSNNLLIAVRESFNVIRKVTNCHPAVPAITISSPSTGICPGAALEFTAAVVNEGSAAVYQWEKNGLPVGNNSPAYTGTALLNGDVITCRLSSTNNCESIIQVMSNPITISILPEPAILLAQTKTLCTGSTLTLDAGNFSSYKWSTGSLERAIRVDHPGLYAVTVTDTNGCTATGRIQVNAKECISGFFMPNAFTPNKDGKNDLLKPVLPENWTQFQFSIYNRLGQLVFQSANPLTGWDGITNGSKQDSNLYIWTCTYQIEGQPVQHQKGTVTLIR
ncbi:gliding motility-associated C-terminal domain-containing protein [Flavihumibacter fluvii]|uniref:NHL domain-containing protein n=1 Tax=Flavihumibacter fluvii TaxID=2838157 RepID=UPI001BDED0A0|nr:gliding motility-associated C-terminal domain-containing protein [Flavihumibacter fluvii]ULQ54703.1 gliding motility-associated C-terminal domain-containing protein [Flavihumibacter fluvii]